MILSITVMCLNETYFVCQFITHSSQLPTYIHKGNSSFNICTFYTEVTPTVKGLKTSQSTVWRAVPQLLPIVHLISHSWIPVLEETLSSHFPLTSTGCTQSSTPFRRGNSLGYFTPQWTQVPSRAHSHDPGQAELLSSARLINWAHAVKLQSYSNTDCKKAGHRNI